MENHGNELLKYRENFGRMKTAENLFTKQDYTNMLFLQMLLSDVLFDICSKPVEIYYTLISIIHIYKSYLFKYSPIY